MSALKEKRVAVIGQGDPAAAFREVVAEIDELVLTAATTAKAALRGRRVPDLALLCTPVRQHAVELDGLLRAGVDVLVNGPLALSLDEATHATELAERLARTLVTASPLRAFNAVLEAQRLIEAGRIGRLASVEVTLSRKLAPPFDCTAERPGAGVWVSSGCDAIDLVETLAGPLTRMRMLESRRRQKASVEDEVLIHAEHVEGVISRLFLTWNEETPEPVARCRGTGGEIAIGWAQSVLRVLGGERQIFATGYDRHEVCRELLERFLRERRLGNGEGQGEQALGWIEAGYRSLDSRHWEIA